MPAQSGAKNPALRQTHAHMPWLPWSLGAVGLVVYLITLNPWISPESLGTVSSLTGMVWGPEQLEPVLFLVTLPLRSLPSPVLPVALNVFTAFCAALSLVWLARSVSLLPHRIYKRNLKPCRNQPTMLRGRRAWLPPAVAVAVCGLQYSFWANATNASGEMLDLLLFAYALRSLVEYGVSGKSSWLRRGSFAYGLALANDWYMVAFFPALLISLCWLKRLHVFTVPFLSRLLRRPKTFNLWLLAQICGCWLAGLSVFLLKPVLEPWTQPVNPGFWPDLQMTVQNHLATAPLSPTFFLVGGIVTALPMLYLILYYYRPFTALKRLSDVLPRVLFHIIHGFFGLTCLWIMLDLPLSPRQHGLGLACLPLYYLAALSAGYFIGHFVRISELKSSRRERQAARRTRSKSDRQGARAGVDFLRGALAAVTMAVATVVPSLLIYKNLPVILQTRNSPVTQFFADLARTLPAAGAVVIAGDPHLLDYAEAAVMRNGGQSKFLFLNSYAALENRHYREFLQRKYPRFAPDLATAAPLNPTNEASSYVRLIQHLSQNHAVYCLQPSPALDGLAQDFYAEPAGLAYQLKSYPENVSGAKMPEPEPVVADEAFWQSFESGEFPRLARQIHPAAPVHSTDFGYDLLALQMNFHPELDQLESLAGSYYATALNNHGVELQKRGGLAAAANYFDQALQLNPGNSAAQINRRFNQDCQAGIETVLRPPSEEDISLSQFRDWRNVVLDGLVAEPNFCSLMGQILANAHWYRPALAQFELAKMFAPDDVMVAQNLAVADYDGDHFAEAFAESSQVIAREPTNRTVLLIQGLSAIQLQKYAPAIASLTALLAMQPNDALTRQNRALCYLKTGQPEAARRDYEAVARINPDSYTAYFNLAALADGKHDPAEAIKYYELFLKFAPCNHPQISLAKTRLQELKTMAP